MNEVQVLVLTGFGLNCDRETAYSFRLAGASASSVHINSLIFGEVSLDKFHILAFDGGFSWGDDHGAGVIHAVRFKYRLGKELRRFIGEGKLIIGICNGFQVLVNMGLLPGFDGDYETRLVALTSNDCGNFRDDWVWLRTNEKSPCVFTQGLDFIELPIRHGEGKFYSDPVTIKRLFDQEQVVLQYSMPDGRLAGGVFPFNPNGSFQDIAGICDPTGRIFGLMPHPEAYNHWTNHPDWTRKKEEVKRRGKAINLDVTPGIRIFQNGVEYIRKRFVS
nr:phosphoribosylformylglycinamidine synthase subunit PurQ [Desulfobacterales bacterium]